MARSIKKVVIKLMKPLKTESTKKAGAERPKEGDKADVRCAFVGTRPGKHDLGEKPEGAWCHGCGFYICDACDSPFGVSGPGHDVAEHDPNADEED